MNLTEDSKEVLMAVLVNMAIEHYKLYTSVNYDICKRYAKIYPVIVWPPVAQLLYVHSKRYSYLVVWYTDASGSAIVVT